jgi:hypothetical protein
MRRNSRHNGQTGMSLVLWRSRDQCTSADGWSDLEGVEDTQIAGNFRGYLE